MGIFKHINMAAVILSTVVTTILYLNNPQDPMIWFFVGIIVLNVYFCFYNTRIDTLAEFIKKVNKPEKERNTNE